MVEKESAEIFALSQETIEHTISKLKQENQQQLDTKIAAFKQEAKQKLDARIQEEQTKAQERFQTRLKHVSDRGYIARERQKQTEAKKAVEDKRLEIAQSDAYFP
ncbi:MAG: hypothetical protein H0U75_12550 [Legionella sp.]|nr:hypothetical protein [Legionella sp.]